MEIINKTSFQFAPFVGRIGFPDYSLTFIIKSTFDLTPDGIATVAEEQLFPTGNEPYPDDDGDGTGSSRYESDFAYFKAKTDLLLAGTCYSPSGQSVAQCQVSFQVGNNRKSLQIFGNRDWNGLIWKTKSSPEIFSKMELRYENSFGGEGYSNNPVGKGFRKKKIDKTRPLPNIEDSRNAIGFKTSHPEPAGFGPLNNLWPTRYSKLGTYKGQWLKERWPWFPIDFDWGYYNAAPPDMQVDGYITGDEQLYLENLHPEHSQYYCHLPGLRLRCFTNKLVSENGKQTQFEEISLNLDTLWVDMDSEKLVLVWRGVTGVQSEEYEEILHTFIASEKLTEQAQPVDYYYDLFLKALKEEDTFELESPSGDEEEEKIDIAVKKAEAEIVKAKQDAREALIAAGIDPDAELPAVSEEDKAVEEKIIKEYGIDEYITTPLTREAIQQRLADGDTFANEDLRGLDLSELDMPEVDFKEALMNGANLKNTNLSKAALVEADLAEVDLSGADLTEADLTDADLTGANLSGADLTGAILEGTLFENAKMANAVLDGAKASDANFVGANLSSASFKNGIFKSSDFSNSNFDNANFQGATLCDASVEGSTGINVNMSETDLTGLRASEGCDFSNASFQKAIAFGAIWEKANLKETDFSLSHMEGADFSSASLEGAFLAGANFKYARFSKANLTGAVLRSINLFQGSLEKTNLTNADFSGSNLYGVEFLDAEIKDTVFKYTNLKMTKLA